MERGGCVMHPATAAGDLRKSDTLIDANSLLKISVSEGCSAVRKQ
jgi:hypothetical protein